MIIAMEAWQHGELQSSFSGHLEKLFLLPLLDPKGSITQHGYAAFNIRDPYGGPPSVFEECFERIGACLKGFAATMRS